MSSRKPPVVVTLSFDPHEMSLRGRIGAAVTHSRHDSRKLTAPAREAFLSKFEQEVDPTGVLPPEERSRRAEHARKAHMARLSRLSVMARRKAADAAKEATNVVA